MRSRLLIAVVLALSSVVVAQPTEDDTRRALAELVASRHEGKPNGWEALTETLARFTGARQEVLADWNELGARGEHPLVQDDLIRRGPWPRPGLEFGERMIAAAGAHSAFRSLHRVAQIGRAWPPAEMFPATHLDRADDWNSRSRSLMRLRLAAMRIDAVEGNADKAVEGAVDLLALARIHADQILLIDRILGGSLYMAIFEEMRHEATEGLLDAASCRTLIAAIDSEVALPPYEMTAEAERILEIGSFTAQQRDQVGEELPALVRELEAALRADAPPADVPAPGDVHDAHGLIRFIAKLHFETLELGRSTDRLLRSSADATRLVLALEIWRIDHGAYPEALRALTPDHLPAIPEDAIARASSVIS